MVSTPTIDDFHCLFWNVRILCCDDTTTRALFAGRFLSFFLLEGSILVCHLLTTYFISLSVVWKSAHEGITGVLTREASQAAKLLFGIRHRVGFESARLARDIRKMAFEESIELAESIKSGYKMAILDAFVNQGGQRNGGKRMEHGVENVELLLVRCNRNPLLHMFT